MTTLEHFFSQGRPPVPLSREEPVDPPNPDYIRVHAAFSKVLYLSEVSDYMHRVMWSIDYEGALGPDEETEFAPYLWSKLRLLN